MESARRVQDESLESKFGIWRSFIWRRLAAAPIDLAADINSCFPNITHLALVLTTEMAFEPA